MVYTVTIQDLKLNPLDDFLFVNVITPLANLMDRILYSDTNSQKKTSLFITKICQL